MPNDEYIGWTVYFGRIAQRQELADKMSRHQGR